MQRLFAHQKSAADGHVHAYFRYIVWPPEKSPVGAFLLYIYSKSRGHTEKNEIRFSVQEA